MASPPPPSLPEEATPLLPQRVDDENENEDSNRVISYRNIAIVISLIVFATGFAQGLLQAPMLAVLELSICRRYYHVNATILPFSGDWDESVCKISAIQSILAKLRGTSSLLESIPGFAVGLLYGKLADAKGKRAVLLLSTTGMTLSLIWYIVVCYFYNAVSPTAVLYSGLFLFIGGGPQVFNAMILTILADVLPEEKRTSFFYTSSAIGLVSAFISPAVGGLLMHFGSPFTPFAIAVPAFLVVFPLILCLPETRTSLKSASATPEETSLVEEGLRNEDLCEVEREATKDGNIFQALWRHWIDSANSIVAILSQSSLIRAAAFADFLSSFGVQIMAVLMQYVSKKYGWTDAKASLVYTIKGGINLVLFATILPGISLYLGRRISARSTTMWISRGSILALTLGALAMGLAPNITMTLLALGLFSCGSGLSMSLKSASATGMSKDTVGTLYTGLASIETLGGVIGNPMLSYLYALSIGMENVYALGIPFYVVTGFYIAAAIAIFRVRVD